jgi:hypothetical protein
MLRLGREFGAFVTFEANSRGEVVSCASSRDPAWPVRADATPNGMRLAASTQLSLLRDSRRPG